LADKQFKLAWKKPTLNFLTETPSHDTLVYVLLAALKPLAFQDFSRHGFRELLPLDEEAEMNPESPIDGKGIPPAQP